MSSDRSEEERVRELLADARHTEPIPDDVAARLDAALADLRGETPATPSLPRRDVPDLAAARRRRTARNLLVAAAAIVVVGVGISRIDLDSAGMDADGASADSSAAGAAAGEPESHSDADAPRYALGGPPVRLSSDDFGHQLRRLTKTVPTHGDVNDLASLPTPQGDAGADDFSTHERDGSAAARVDCDPGSWGPGHRVKVRYDGKAGVLIYRPVQGDTQVVDLYLCGHEDPTRSITLAQH